MIDPVAQQPCPERQANIPRHTVVPDAQPASSLTRVELYFVEHHLNRYLRFGHPVSVTQQNRHRRLALFAPGMLFCRIHWQANDYGTIHWQLLALHSGTSRDAMQRIPGIHPGARILLQARGERQVRLVLQCIDAIEALHIDPATTAPSYWQALHNRLAGGQPLPAYTAERHAAWQCGNGLGGQKQ